MRMVDHTPADGSHQASPNGAQSSAADDDHRSLLGKINKRCGRVAGDDVAADVDTIATSRRILGDLPCLAQDFMAIQLVPLLQLWRSRYLGPHPCERRRNHVDKRQRKASQ